MSTRLSTQFLNAGSAVVTALHTTERNIFVALDDGTVIILDSDGGNEKTLRASEKGGVWALDTGGKGDEEWLAVGGTDCLVGVWKVGDLEKKATLVGHTNTVRCIKALSVTKVLSGSRDTTLRIWNLKTSQCEAIFEGHRATIRHIAVKDDIAVSVSYDTDARIWNLEKKECLHVLKDHTNKLLSVAFDGKRIVTGSMDNTVRIWDPVTGACQAIIQGYESLVSLLELTPSTLISASAGGQILLWSLDDQTEISRTVAHSNSVTTLRSEGDIIVSGGSDGKVKLWDLKTGALLDELLNSDAVWKVDILGKNIVALFSRNNEVVLDFWAVPAST